MSAESKLQSYKGSSYDGRKLEEARRTLRAAITQFPEQLESERPRVLRELEEIRQEQAKSQFEVGEWYRTMATRSPKQADKFNRAARLYFMYVQKNFTGTKWADRATEQLEQLNRTAVPAQTATSARDEQ